MNKTTTIVVAILVLVGALLIWKLPVSENPADQQTDTATTTAPSTATTTAENPADEAPVENPSETKIGSSVEGRDIVAYHYGTGDKEILFVGGIHGGYSWNTAKVAYELMDYLEDTEDKLPSNIKVTVIPVLNPDGLTKAVGTTADFEAADVNASADVRVASRFNANNVDLNRNFGCDWKAEGMWQSKKVSGGTEAFSEPESQAFRSYIESHNPEGVVVWYSSAGGVYASNCHDGVLPETTALADLYGKAAGYSVHKEYNFYEITGDMVNWLASKDIPAISVLLTTHTSTEWTKNRAGIDAVINFYANR
jgi:murein tripeptide amidase MpaA